MSLILQPHRRDGLVLAVACGLIGLPYGVLAVARRAPMVAVVMVAMAVTALLRVVV